MNGQHTLGQEMGWKTVAGWVIFILGTVEAALSSAGHPVALGIEPEVWLALAAIGAGWAHIGQRHAQAKQMRVQSSILDLFSKAAVQAAVQVAVPAPVKKKAAARKGAKR